MNRFVAIACASAVALSISLSMAAPASANPAQDAAAAGFVGGVLGFMAGAAAASSAPPHHHVMVEEDDYDYGYYAHVRACQHAYRWRYDADSDSYLASNGRRYACDL